MMNSTNDGDPFIQVQTDAISLLGTTRQIFSSYLRIRSLATSSTSLELSSARSEVLAALDDLRLDLEDIQLAVSECERDPYRFGLEIDEVGKRRRWLIEVEGEVSDMKEEVAKEASFVGAKGRSSTLGVNNGAPVDDEYSRSERDGDDPYTANEQMYQQQIMRDQDEQLEGVYRTVGNLRGIANDMGRELEEQRDIIEDTEAIAERVEGKLKKGIKGIDKFIKKNEDRWSSCCISVLIMVLIILLVLILIA